MNWKVYDRKRRWHNLKLLYQYLPERIKDTHKKNLRIASVWADI
jgi:hypothetical protein